jgi:glucosamine--fructose-6-phosphate aminotransferase (isomerizing)
MVEPEKSMSRLPMLENIFGQPESLRSLLEFHAGEGRSTLRDCAERIRNAQGRLIFTAMGASYFAALPAVGRLVESGFAAQAIESAELLHYGSGALRRGDVGVLISRSGGSIEVLRLAEKMRALGMTIVGVTNVADSELGRASDVTLPIGSQPDQLIAVQSYTGTMVALRLLAEQVISSEGAAFAAACHAGLPAFSAHIDECFRLSESWQDLLDSETPLYFLGRGPALASVGEGALLLHETAKAAAVGMSSGQFRHGPVEAVSKDFRAIVFGSPERTRAIDRSLADDLFRMGGIVRWIGPSNQYRDSGGQAPSLVPWPDVAPELAQIFDIVPLQFAAYRLALWRGIVPGDFRYASEVTSSESEFPLFQAKLANA